jgi:hypothetical protein
MIAAHLYVTAADAANSPRPVPLTHEILLDGPTVGVFDSDPPGQLIPMVFVVDPPLVLPHKGIYAWFLQPENCAPGAAWYVCADTSDSYPSGDAWTTIRTFGECHLPTLEGMEDHQDYIFEVQYCDAAVPTRRRTWGELKLIYR